MLFSASLLLCLRISDCLARRALRAYLACRGRDPPVISPSSPGSVIEFDALSKAYGDFAAVRGLSLAVRPGEVYALLGANGAGKTTALRCLATLLKPTSGTARIAGYDVRLEPLEVRRRLGFLAASMGLYARLTSRELLAYFARLQGVEEERVNERVEDVVARFGIGPFADRLCGRLSTGQRQRVNIARATVHDPPALVLDEPTLGLDVLSGEAIYDFIADARSRGRAVLFSTHHMSEVELLADRVGILAGGRLAEEGTIHEVLERSGEESLARAFLRIAREAA
ncbi:ABC transporter ATP-binding protein [Longimicrobium terrae]|nr:ABC transporter ATP-binding protein [Longimicrobium terrae]NNC32904.1 ABC transporter ATP-binding protein [Longimicrobium terrae]